MRTLALIFLLATVALGAAPTIVPYTIQESGGDFHSLKDFEDGVDGDLTSTNVIIEARIQGNWTNPDPDGATTIAGWTTSSTCYLCITNSTSKHSGKYTSTAYSLDGAGTTSITINEDFIRIYGIQVLQTSTAGGRHGIYITGVGTGTTIIIADSIFKGVFSGASGGGTGVLCDDADATITVYNCMIYDWINSSVTCRGISIQNCTLSAYNCTAQNCYVSYNRSSGTLNTYNCISQDDGNDDYGGTVGGDYNNTDRASGAPGANSVNNYEAVFADEAGDDFHLSASDSSLIGSGLDDPASGLFSTDIDGTTRSDWEIGADEYVAASTSGQVIIIRQH